MDRVEAVNTRRHTRPPTSSTVMLLAGEGWGKTAAAIGYAVRAAGRDWPTTVVQFVKGTAWNHDEASVLQADRVRWRVFHTGYTWGAEARSACARAWAEARNALSGDDAGVVILDEITRTVDHGWLDPADIARAIRVRNPATSVILTGKTAPDELVDVADTVTNFELAKHEHRSGILAP